MDTLIKNIKKYWFRYLLFSAITSTIAFIYGLSSDIAYNTDLNVALSGGEKSVLKFRNIGKYSIEISDVNVLGLYSKCIHMPRNSDSLAPGAGMHDTLSLAQISKAYDAKGLVLTPEESWEHTFFSEGSPDTYCYYDVKITYSFESTSFWAALIQYVMKLADVIDPKSEIFLRYNGCNFRQVGEGAYLQTTQAYDKGYSEIDWRDLELYECVASKDPSYYRKLIRSNEIMSQWEEEAREMYESFSDKEIVLDFWDTVSRLEKMEETRERVITCNLLRVMMKNMKDRGILKFTKRNIEKLRGACLGIPPDLL